MLYSLSLPTYSLWSKQLLLGLCAPVQFLNAQNQCTSQWQQPQIPPALFHLPSTFSSAVVLGLDWPQTHNRHSDNPFNFSGCKTHSLKTSVKIFSLCRCVLARPRPCPLIGSVIAHSTLLLELLPLFGIPSLCLRQS